MNLGEFRFRPRLADSLRGYTKDDFRADAAAGVTVGVVALPLAMAFGIASGVKPEQGIFTAIIAGFLIATLGGSKVQIGGPAGAFVVLLYAIVERYGVASLLISTFMAGVLMFAMGALRLGNLIRFIPVSIVIGFTNGIAVIIALQQVKDFLGLSIAKMPANFFSQVDALWHALDTLNTTALALGAASLAIVVFWPKSYAANDASWRRWMARVPGTIVVLLLGTLAVSLAGLQVETIGTRFGGIPQGLPAFSLPEFNWETAQNLAMPTLSIALLGAIESLLCARVADGLIHDRHDPNQELMAQGIANFVAPFFGGIAATGTVARTVTNVRSGARTPIAGIVHSATLLAIVLALAPLAHDIPLASLAAILLFVAWNMGDWREFARLRHFSLSYRTILLATFLLTVVFDITVAVQAGLVLASLFFMYRMSDLTRIERIALPELDGAETQLRADGTPRVLAYKLSGSLFFGAANKLENLLLMQDGHPDVVILDMDRVISLDTTGLDILQTLHRNLNKRGAHLILCHLGSQPGSIVFRSGFLDKLGDDNITATLEEAVARARLLSGKEPEIAYA